MISKSRSGIELKPFYSPEDSAGNDYVEKLNSPGEFPYTRGIRPNPSGYWIQRELSGEGTPVRSNQQFKYLLQKGQMGLDVIGDSPAQASIDPDHPLAAATVGTQGVSVCCLRDYLELFDGIPLDKISISSSLPAAFTMAGLFLTAKERGIPADKLRGSSIQAPFYAEDCGYAYHLPLPLRIRLACDSVQFATQKMQRFHSFLEDTYFFSESGLTGVEEMALGFVEIRFIIRQLMERGVDIDSFAPRIAILVNCSMDFFEEIAKIRATRRLFARMMRDEFGAKDPRSLAVVISCHTSGLSLTAQQAFNNIVRGSVQATALVLAGVQAMEISAFDEGYRTPSEASHLVGLRTQQVIHLESNITKVQDPLGGSYYVEALTDRMENQIDEMIKDIEARGDAASLSEEGWFKGFFRDAMERYQNDIDLGNISKVGVNTLQIPDDEDTLLKDVSEGKIKPSRERIKDIQAYKENRDQRKLKGTMQVLHDKTCDASQDLMLPLVSAMEVGATTGEITGVMRQAFGKPYDPHGMIESPFSFTKS